MFCYKAVFDGNSASIATVGADKMLNVWDVRFTKNPVMRVFSNSESNNCLINCDFLPNNQQIVTTSNTGEVSVYSVKKLENLGFLDT